MDKFKFAEWLLRQGAIVVALDTTKAEVDVPKHLRGRRDITLDIGHNMPLPIQDLHVGPWGFSGGLFFSQGGLYNVFVPWAAVYYIGNAHQQMGWEADAPSTFKAPVVATETPLAKVFDMADFKRRKAEKDGLR